MLVFAGSCSRDQRADWWRKLCIGMGTQIHRFRSRIHFTIYRHFRVHLLPAVDPHAVQRTVKHVATAAAHNYDPRTAGRQNTAVVRKPSAPDADWWLFNDQVVCAYRYETRTRVNKQSVANAN